MSGLRLFGVTLLRSSAEQELHKLFDGYKKTLSEQKSKISDDIAEWRDKLIRDIHKYANGQKDFLEQQYEYEVRSLDDKRQDFIDTLRTCQKSNDTDQIQRLLDLCNSLQIELATVKYHQQDIMFIQLTRPEPASVNLNGFNIVESRNGRPRNSLPIEDNHGVKNNMNADTDSFRSPGQIPNGKLPTMNSGNGDSRSTNSDGNQNYYYARDDNVSEKCPVCFMIFPLTMTARDQSEHVSEHYRDD